MKLKKLTLILAFIIIPVVFSLAEGPGGPGSGSNGNGTPVGNGGIPVGADAPLGSGFILMLIFSGLYGSKKVYGLKKKKT